MQGPGRLACAIAIATSIGCSAAPNDGRESAPSSTEATVPMVPTVLMVPTVPTVPAPSGLVEHGTIDFSFATPPNWLDAGSHPDFLKYESARAPSAIVAAAFVTPSVSLEDDAAFWRSLLAGMQAGVSCGFTLENTTFRGDPAIRIHASCTPSSSRADLDVLAVLHEGRVFDVSCGGEGDASSCPAIVTSLRFSNR